MLPCPKCQLGAGMGWDGLSWAGLGPLRCWALSGERVFVATPRTGSHPQLASPGPSHPFRGSDTRNAATPCVLRFCAAALRCAALHCTYSRYVLEEPLAEALGFGIATKARTLQVGAATLHAPHHASRRRGGRSPCVIPPGGVAGVGPDSVTACASPLWISVPLNV